MRLFLILTASLCALGARPAPAQSQSLMELLRSIQQGGGWVSIPVAQGEGAFRTVPLPVGGLNLTGCVQVWPGHSGSWDIRARDLVGEGELDVSLRPGEAAPFAYEAGPQSQLEVSVRWSEPRDTTFLLWVGLEAPRLERDPCEPVYSRR